MSAPRNFDPRRAFEEKVARAGPDECWLWLGNRNTQGYGRLTLNGKHRRAHQVALEFAGKHRPGSAFALHSCDNPPCCNPAHLRWGSRSDNYFDMLARNRASLSNLSDELRRAGIARATAARTHCPNGHAYTDENVYRRKHAGGVTTRACREYRRANKRQAAKRSVSA